ncbi:C4-dicarboxylate ABC transporter substrate-binding protein [Candidatus Atribacteria bacterium HGW-Atribacteria-1]|nr:MAG: C4-dicarboxylate ABC transporter substrate-binding protein [Candidatus Atribacteria bacterium HGW-Atribacteria-1]
MKKRKLNGLGFVLALILLFSVTIGYASPKETVYLNMGSTSSTSGLYAWCVAGASVINKADNNIKVTVVESGAALDNLRRIKDGVFDFGFCVDIASAMQLYKGISTFEGEGWEPIRWLFLRNAIINRVYVRADSGVKTFTDLGGKKFCPGIPGASSTNNFINFDKAVESGIDLVPAALGDAIDSLKQGKIVGLQKSSGLTSVDSSLIEVNLRTPLAAIGYSEDDMKKIKAAYPYILFSETTAGSILELPNNSAVMEEIAVVGVVASSSLSEEVGYEIVKAYVEGFEEVAAAYPGIKGFDPIGDVFKLVAPGGEIPIHAGLYKYCLEKGIEVPERFIPPESKK